MSITAINTLLKHHYGIDIESIRKKCDQKQIRYSTCIWQKTSTAPELWYFIDPLHTESISPRIKLHKSFFFYHCIPAIYTLDFKINTDIQISVVCYMETFELSEEIIIGLRSFFCCLFGTSSRTNPRISSKSCLKYTICITNYTCDTQF